MKMFAGVLVAGLVLSARVVGAQSYTYPQLVERMTDMEMLARLPAVGEKTSLASSYDRNSKYDATTDKYVRWDANGDGGGFIRKEGDGFVLADIVGPGVITRIWSATPGAGHVKIYLDGSATPAVDLAFKDYFSQTVEPFTRKHIVYGLQPEAPGFDNYTPISFAKSCRIVADKGWGEFYQFTYTQLPEGTVVPTFSMAMPAADQAALDRADAILAAAGQMPDGKGVTKTVAVQAMPGKETTVAEMRGKGAITAVKVRLALPADAEAARLLLGQLTVSMAWDGTPPAVWSPLGDFFGYVGGAKPYRSLPMGLLPDGTFYSYWYMPFGKKARISVGNDGTEPVAMTWEITREKLRESIAKLARFHAKWHRDAFLPTRPDRQIDWTLLTTTGRGRYVGTHLHGWNPIGGWWGEGDDKFFVDGEKFPSSFGTGTEDYFGYAWSSSNVFSRPYHGQILNENNVGHFDDNRWHIADSVPFQTSFEGDLEKYFKNRHETQFAAEAFWYLDAKGSDPYTVAVPLNERVGYWRKTNIRREKDVIEAEWLRVNNKPAVEPQNEIMLDYGPGWSSGRQLYWQGKVGDALELALPVQKAGTYRVLLKLTEGPDYGVSQVSLDGVEVGGPLDLYAATVKPGDTVDLGAQALTAGPHVMKITIVGKNAAATGTAFGADWVKLVAVEEPRESGS